MAPRSQPQRDVDSAADRAIPPEVLRRVRQIEIRSRRLVNQLFTGSYAAVFRGRGMEFSDVRAYQAGDEVRTIDWNVTARLGEPYVKRFVEERELTVMLAVDISPSQAFGSGDMSKREVAAEVAAVLALSAVRNNDKVGLVTFTDRIETVVRPGKGRRHALRIVRELLFAPARGHGTDISGAIDYVATVLHRRAIIFLMSDFQDQGYEGVLRIAGRRHDVIAVTATDPRELALPNAGLIEVQDAESGAAMLIDTADRRLRRRYAEAAAAQRETRRQSLRASGIDQIDLRTDEPYVAPLIAYFQRRAHRLAGGASRPGRRRA